MSNNNFEIKAAKNYYELAKMVNSLMPVTENGYIIGLGINTNNPDEVKEFLRACSDTAAAKHTGIQTIMMAVMNFKENAPEVQDVVTVKGKTIFINYDEKIAFDESLQTVAELQINTTIPKEAIKELLLQQI